MFRYQILVLDTGVSGLNEGEVVSLPSLTNLAGETVNLAELGKDRLLCVLSAIDARVALAMPISGANFTKRPQIVEPPFI